MQPVEIRLAQDRREVEIDWDDGSRDALSASCLRDNCRSSRALRHRIDGKTVDSGITITDIEPVGLYAVNIAFSDGQARGIYPWSYLRELAQSARPAGN